ncbi:MAG: response regulator [bacterium]|nr:response regulator [bacterium]
MESRHRILVVSEDPGLTNHLGQFLADKGFDYRCMTSAEEALACYGDWPADLVIAEQAFTSMKGIELASWIHQDNPRVRFIMINSPGETPEFVDASRHRIVAFLSKPFNPDDLLYYIRGALGLAEPVLNRREYNRYLFHVETHCIIINPFDNSESRPIVALLRDISRSGVSMIVRQLFPVPCMLKLVLNLHRQGAPMNMLAKSVACTMTQIPDVYRLGAKFVGLLPEAINREIMQLNRNDLAGSDIYMGKTFRNAVWEWLSEHPERIAEEVPGGERPLNELVAELCHNTYENEFDNGEVHPPDKK